MIRLFVALPLPGPQRRRLAQICTGIEGARWLDDHNLHLTLRFIGEVPEDHGEDLAIALSSVKAAPFELRLKGVGHFGSNRGVRAVWADIEPAPDLTQLRANIDATLQRAGLAPEHRKFHPHVTLARLRHATPDAIAPWLAANTLFTTVPFTIGKFALFSSHLGKSGADYTMEMEYSLG
jgi:2'-5' RNA ligase